MINAKSDTKEILKAINRIYSEDYFPEEFLEKYDQIECLAKHNGRETYLVKEKASGRILINESLQVYINISFCVSYLQHGKKCVHVQG